MSAGFARVRAASWLAHTDPAGLLYGAIVSAAVLATVSAHAEGSGVRGARHRDRARRVLDGTRLRRRPCPDSSTATRATSCFACALERPRDRASSRAACRPSSSTLGTSAAGMDIASAAATAVYFTVVLLAVVGYLGAHQAGLRGRGRAPRGGRRRVLRSADRRREGPPALTGELLERRGESREPVQRRRPHRSLAPRLQGQFRADLPVVMFDLAHLRHEGPSTAPSARSRCSGRTTSCPCCSSRSAPRRRRR